MVDNGSLVTRAELEAHLKPIRDDVGEIRHDVKELLLAHAGSTALKGLSWRLIGVAATLLCGVLAGLLLH